MFPTNRLDADQIAMEWVAFSNSRGNCKLNFETLDLLDRERLSKKAKRVGLYVYVGKALFILSICGS